MSMPLILLGTAGVAGSGVPGLFLSRNSTAGQWVTTKPNFYSEVPDVVLDEVVLPTVRGIAWFFSLFRWFQQGRVQMYLLYLFAALLVLLLWR